MNRQVMILGASGVFGSRIATRLARYNIPLILAGRNRTLINQLKTDIARWFPACNVQVIFFDIKNAAKLYLSRYRPGVVINTCGPFQTANYDIALDCIDLGIHYIDLADSRSFVNGIAALDAQAKAADCIVISGASTVPALSSAVIDSYREQFQRLDSLVFGIAPGQKTPRGLATTRSVLSYLGKPFPPFPGMSKSMYGWQNLYRQDYPVIGKRWMGNCDIPDLDLLPQYYGLRSIRFSAGMESSALHLSLWVLSWLVRLGLPLNLNKHAKKLLKLSRLFDCFGSGAGGMHLILSGEDKSGVAKTVQWFIIVKHGRGPFIPTIPAVIMTKKILENKFNHAGARPCIGLFTLAEFIEESSDLDIEIYSR